MKKTTRNIALLITILIGILVLSEFVFKRFDMTYDQRYSLSETTHEILEGIEKPLKINVLLGGELSGDYRTLKNEISFLLDEFRTINPKISYQFLDPSKDFSMETLQENGLAPAPVRTDKGILNVYPYAQISFDGKESWMETLVNDPALPFEQLALASTEKLEYLFMEDLRKITQVNRKNIGFLVHHDELGQLHMDGLGRALADNYNVDVFLKPVQDSTYSLQQEDLKDLLNYDALVVAKPTLPFTDMDKLVMDQYIMNGGKMMFLTEMVDAEMDSIFRSGKIVAFPRDMKLNEFFFNYGIRIIPAIVKDLEASKIVLADGETTAGNISYNSYTWPYFVRGFKADENPITQSINSVKFEFANPIELLENPNVQHEVLLATSPYTSLQPSMSFIELAEVDEINPQEYEMGRIPLAVLAQGNLKSAFAARYEREEFPNFKSETTEGKLLVISDGDVAKNHVLMGRPMRLGEDKYSLRPDNPKQRPVSYDNQNFLTNSIDYLLGETDFLNLKNRKLEIPTLNETKVKLEKSSWQMTNLIIPVLGIWILGIGMIWWRKKRFSA
ncbi:gliding motility-associated ABC transporter substrate-binding protein GldG [Moheibacter stercoris]|uniref:Gliding-associated putative ABC transporter substrate-binding component GldG n=1 Tax=Moheibacter stercoris TaxID=1628251 RepID=A0ABV2LUA2_9FLAO